MARLLPPERDIGVLRAPVRSCLALTGGFLLVLLSVGLLERIGIAPGAALAAVVGAAFALFALAALLSHSRRAADFYVADRKISGSFGGLASGGSFAGLITIGAIGGAFATETSFLLAAGGFTLGYLLLAIIIAPGLRSFGAYTPGDFLATRFGGFRAQLGWAIVAFSVSFLLLVAHLKIAGPLLATLMHISPENALYAVAAITVAAALPGGMRSLTWTQAIQYFVIVLACLIPAGFMLVRGPAGENAIAQDLGGLLAENLPPLSNFTTAQAALPAVLAVIGAASLPHLMARSLTSPSGREASSSLMWGVLFAAIIVFGGLALAELLAGAAASGFADGGVAGLATLLTPLPAVLTGLFLAGVLAALFALGQATLFAAATAISHDVFDEILDKRGPEGRRIVAARLILVAVAAGAAMLVPRWQAEAAVLLEWALALAAAGAFAPLVLGLWWRRCNEVGALSGMAAGFGFTCLVFLMDRDVISTTLVSSGWANVGAPTAAIAGLVIAVVVTIGLSLMTPAPEAEMQKLVKDTTSGRGGQPIRERPA